MREKLTNLSFVLAGVLIICHVGQFIDSGYKLEPLLRVALWAAYIPAGLKWREKCLPVIFPIFAYAVLIFNRFQNYTSFFLIIFSIQLNKKWEWQYLGLYFLDVAICLVLHQLQATHALIHLLNCAWIYAAYKVLFALKPNEKLDLEPDEVQILAEWAEAGELKAVRCFSHNTVFDKLRAARVRNNCTSNDELLKKYLDQYGDPHTASIK